MSPAEGERPTVATPVLEPAHPRPRPRAAIGATGDRHAAAPRGDTDAGGGTRTPPHVAAPEDSRTDPREHAVLVGFVVLYAALASLLIPPVGHVVLGTRTVLYTAVFGRPRTPAAYLHDSSWRLLVALPVVAVVALSWRWAATSRPWRSPLTTRSSATVRTHPARAPVAPARTSTAPTAVPTSTAPTAVPTSAAPTAAPTGAAPAALTPTAILKAPVATPPAVEEQPSEEAAPPTREELLERFGAVSASAVDPLEIACALEFEGLNDAAAQRYGADDIFALADELYRTVPRDPAEPAPPADPWADARRRPALHGLLYGLPAVCFPVAAHLLVGPGAITVFLVALLTAWTLSQTLAYLGYRALRPTSTEHARQVLLAGLAAGLGLSIAIIVATALTVHATLPAFWLGVGQATYMLGASVLFVLGRERWVMGALVPGIASCAIFLLLGRPADLHDAVWVLLALTPLLALAFAIGSAWTPAWRRPPIAAGDVGAALPTAAFGLSAAGLLVFPAVNGLHGHGGVNPGVLLATLPISVSMGGAEWCLLWFRRRSRRLLRTTRDPIVFTRKVRCVLTVAVLQYVAIAVVLVVGTVWIGATVGLLHPDVADVPQVLAYLLLGVAMFLALTVQAVGLRAYAVCACAAALAFELLFHDLGVSAQLIACSGLIVAIGGYALIELGATTRHAT